jgi:hypothetical protein
MVGGHGKTTVHQIILSSKRVQEKTEQHSCPGGIIYNPFLIRYGGGHIRTFFYNTDSTSKFITCGPLLGTMRKILLVSSAVIIILLLALFLLAQPATETTPYTVKGNTGEIEFRHYPAMVLATVDSPGSDAGFNPLFAYISGSNKARSKIPMTAPVITSEKIPMTSPVVSDASSMSFVMPAGKSRDEIPDPLDSRVRIVTIPERDVAVIRFSGDGTQQDVDTKTSRLQEGLKNAGINAVGQPFLMRYDSPWTPGFLRRNEVGVEIGR